MSNWTHVAGVIRIDAIRFGCCETPDFDELIGKEYSFSFGDDDIEELCCGGADSFMPLGSEGSLHKSVFINPNESAAAAYVVTIWGDLRDHDAPNEIVDWFKGVCNKFWTRQACITVENEWYGTLNWTWTQ